MTTTMGLMKKQQQPLSGQRIEECNSKQLKNHSQGHVAGQSCVEQKRIPKDPKRCHCFRWRPMVPGRREKSTGREHSANVCRKDKHTVPSQIPSVKELSGKPTLGSAQFSQIVSQPPEYTSVTFIFASRSQRGV